MEIGTPKQTLSHYWQELRRYPWLWAPLLVLLPLGVFLINFAQPYVVAKVIDRLSHETIPGDRLWDELGGWIILFILSVATGELVVWRIIVGLGWLLEKRVVFHLYQRCFDRLVRQSANFHANRMGGSLVSQTNKFTGSYIQLANVLLFQILPLLSALVFTFVILTPLVPFFAIGLAVLCAIFMLISVFSFRRVRHLNQAETIANNNLSARIADMVTNILAVKSFGREAEEQAEFTAANHEAQSKTQQIIRAVLLRDLSFGGVLVTASIFMLLVLVEGPSHFGMTIGTLVLVASYSFAIFNRLWSFNNILRDINRAFGNAAPMTALLNVPIEVADPPNPQHLEVKKGEISFKNVTFSHPDAKGSDNELFKNFSLKINAGEKVGLVGHSGSGKTTLTKILLRFADIDSGKITIDGQDIAKIYQTELRSAIAYVPQEPLLFHRSIRENVLYGKPNATEKELEVAIRRAHAYEFVQSLPEGLDTIVGERGVKLSGGQRQRIAIARALLKAAPILLLDEATSALDSESEKLIQNALWELMVGRTAIVIAHRLSTIQQMDQIVVMERGKIREQGPHNALIEQNGIYAKLWKHQSNSLIES
jgi:ATP-binding cassette subfamily B protein